MLKQTYSITDLFAHKYHELYINVPYNTDDIHDLTVLLRETLAINRLILIASSNSTRSKQPFLNATLIHEQVLLYSCLIDHIINAPDELFLHLACLFSL